MPDSESASPSEPDIPKAAPGAKMMFLIRRRPSVSREELIAHWFANHMPGVISAQTQAARDGHPHAWRYLATLFDPLASTAASAPADPAAAAWDGVAQLWFDQPLPRPRQPFGDPPRDSFQQKAEPYRPWATVEYVVVDGSEHLSTEPLTLNAPYPTTRSGFVKAVYLVVVKPDTDYVAFARHWLTVHAPNVRKTLLAAGGFRYVISMSLDPANEPYAGMAELYFPDAAAWNTFHTRLESDGTERWLDRDATELRTSGTEMIGIP